MRPLKGSRQQKPTPYFAPDTAHLVQEYPSWLPIKSVRYPPLHIEWNLFLISVPRLSRNCSWCGKFSLPNLYRKTRANAVPNIRFSNEHDSMYTSIYIFHSLYSFILIYVNFTFIYNKFQVICVRSRTKRISYIEVKDSLTKIQIKFVYKLKKMF